MEGRAVGWFASSHRLVDVTFGDVLLHYRDRPPWSKVTLGRVLFDFPTNGVRLPTPSPSTGVARHLPGGLVGVKHPRWAWRRSRWPWHPGRGRGSSPAVGSSGRYRTDLVRSGMTVRPECQEVVRPRHHHIPDQLRLDPYRTELIPSILLCSGARCLGLGARFRSIWGSCQVVVYQLGWLISVDFIHTTWSVWRALWRLRVRCGAGLGWVPGLGGPK